MTTKTIRRGTSLAAVLLSASTLTVVSAVPALAGCPYETGWEVTARADAWMLTSTYSTWVAGPTTIGYAQTATATRGTTKSASISVSAGTIIVKAEAKFAMDWSESTSKSSTWTYSIPVPSGQTARAAVYKRGSRFSVRKYTIGTACTTTYSPTYYQWSPFATTDNSSFCIGKDPYPGTEFVVNSTCAH